ncbi:hypothetical protein MLD38_022765 [Melastoma candidum]|uniref:Uncharacterized protein n=1 Tax=Melastoma candidum TaxID=119954 RepID=A0ACB9QKI5_9MYRT|nr:hypothetical protein MLD38_022765 [Melastoma candidum]
MSVPARTGRDRQRYEDNLRLVSGCIPYRVVEEEQEQESHRFAKRVEVLMVTSPNRDDLVFPKGGWEDDETVEEAACREALEEAGVRGILSEKSIGTWEFRSKSSSQEGCGSPVGGCKGHMFTLEVTEELEAWAEQENRNRRWLTVKNAFQLCRYEWMRQALLKFVNSLDADVRREALNGLAELPHGAGPELVIAPSSSGSKNHCAVPVTWPIVPVEREALV